MDHISPDERLLFEGEEFALYDSRVVQRDGTHAEVKGDAHVTAHPGHGSLDWSYGVPPDGEIAYQSDIPVLEAVYSLAMREMCGLCGEGGVLSTGNDWTTVWTRDTAYATHLSVGIAKPEVCMHTLDNRVSVNGEIEQDTGTGGSWPISSDRIVWGIAAWEVYLMTGDQDWLERSCRILEETCLHDEGVVCDMSGLMRGETSFLDWRNQSYPDWMNASDIGESSSLSTMILHCQARRILADMYRELDKPQRSAYWQEKGDLLEETIQEIFWMPYHGLYGQYVYGRSYPVLSERSDTLGESLSVLFDIADTGKARAIVASMPRCGFGVPCFFPMKTTDLGAYHNEGVWPFVESYYVLAAAKTGNDKAVMAGIASLVRSAMMCGTNKENFSIKTGRASDTVLSSDRQLWSVAGMLGVFYKGLFGLTPRRECLELRPCVPEELAGCHRLMGVKYRQMTFDVTINGYGNVVKLCKIDGEFAEPILVPGMTGHHHIEIELVSEQNLPSTVNWQPLRYDLAMPQWACNGTDLAWFAVPDADYYRIFRNGIPIAQTEELSYVPMSHADVSHYQVMAVSLSDRESFLNEPREHVPCDARLETRPCGLKGDDVWISRLEESERASFYDITLPKAGVYRIDAFYANATGSVRDGNTCALRSLILNGMRVGSLVFPHISEQGQWEDFCYTPGLEVALPAGTYSIELVYQTYDENANYFVNDALIKNIRFTRIHV